MTNYDDEEMSEEDNTDSAQRVSEDDSQLMNLEEGSDLKYLLAKINS
jgi:hypothetical protein